jgi:hypothetical protein
VDHYLGMSTVLNILGLRYTGPGDLPASGRVLAAVLAGDPTLSVRGDQAVDLADRGTSVASLAR